MSTVVRTSAAVPTTAPPAPGGRPASTLLGALVRLARPDNWPKNVLVVCVPLLDPLSWHATALANLGGAVVAFTLASVLVYVANDLVDRRRDALNPSRSHRPLASGQISPGAAVLFAAVVALLLAGVLALLSSTAVLPVVAYLLLNLAYSLGLKHVPLLDVFVVAAGFVLRLVCGYLGTGVAVPGWLVTAVFTVCLLLALGKRRQELRSTGDDHRPALRGYTVPLIDQLMQLSATLAAGSYLLYLRNEAPLGAHASVAAVLLTPMAVFGLFRYLQLVLVHHAGESPSRILVRDPALVANTLLWAVLSAGLQLFARVQA